MPREKAEIVCSDCGAKRITFSRAIRCLACSNELANNRSRDRIKAELQALGHINVEFIPATEKQKLRVSFHHPVCGTQQTWQASNITKRIAAEPTIAPCSKCGGIRRTTNGTAAFVAKYGMSPEREAEFYGYQRRCRQLSDANYRKHKAIINPQNHPRGMRTFHLDHKLPIFEGFKQGLEPAFIARVENLQMLGAFENISKGHRLT